MLTIKVQINKKAAEKYMEDHLSKGDFFSEAEDPCVGETPPPEALAKYYDNDLMRWHGGLTDRLNLDTTKAITKEQFARLLENKHPNTTRQLTSKTTKGRRLYFDATFSAPKSVSIMAITMGDQALIKAHDLATQETIKEMEKFAQTRVRVNGANDLRQTGNILVSSVVHATSRANDPQLHSHNLVFNVTWDDKEKKFKALEASEIYRQTKYLTEVYRNKLASKVRALGYQIEPHKHGWELKGVSSEIREKYSKRSQTIQQLVRDLEKKLGRTLTNNEKSQITHQTRKTKSKSVLLRDLSKEHRSELTKNEHRELNKIKNQALVKRVELSGSDQKKVKELALTRLARAYMLTKNHIFERQSVIEKKALTMATMKQVYGEYEEQEISNLIEKDSEIFHDDNNNIGLIKGLAQEMYINNFIKTSKDKFLDKIRTSEVDGSLREDQKKALDGLVKNNDQVMILDGPAGTGKSFLLKRMAQILAENQVQVAAVAPTSGATLSLVKDLGLQAQTLQGFLGSPDVFKTQKDININRTNEDEESPQPPPQKFLIVDEAGLVSVNQMELLFKIAEEQSIQVLLVGDTRQHHSVECGDALRSIKKYSDVKIYKLEHVVRQKEANYRETVSLIQNHKFEEAWDRLDKNGLIFSSSKNNSLMSNNANGNKSILDSYFEKMNSNKSVIAITPTRAELFELTSAIRHKKYLNYSDKSIKKEVYQSLRFTNAEKMHINSYLVEKTNPFCICFQKKESDIFTKSSFWKVIKKNDGLLLLQGPGEKIATLNLDEVDTSAFDVIRKKEIEINKDDLLIIQKNNKDLGLINGEIVQVHDFDTESILLKDGRTLSKNDNYFDYGYVSTSYSAQGKTCDYVLISMSNSGGKAISAEQFYVSVSRGREGVEIYVEDREYIKAHVSKLGERKLNHEIVTNNSIELLSKSDILKNLKIDNIKDELSKIIQETAIQKSILEKKHKPEINRINQNRSISHLQQQILETASFDKSEVHLQKKEININIEI